jgi:hypothetical protein
MSQNPLVRMTSRTSKKKEKKPYFFRGLPCPKYESWAKYCRSEYLNTLHSDRVTVVLEGALLRRFPRNRLHPDNSGDVVLEHKGDLIQL